MRAVVFAYHNVGVRCLKVLMSQGITIPFVVTHPDNPAENVWFDSVAATCSNYGMEAIMPSEPGSRELFSRVQEAQPDYIFSFYYRHMLPVELLNLARHGAFNMHGSLLPKYRGRAPVNWAVLHGERETGATLHEMTEKPDAGPIIAQTAVPILPDDTAHEVFGKVAVAAEQTLWRAMPQFLAGRIQRLPNDLSKGSYFSGRKPEDGKIDWSRPAQEVYNLHRAVAPPYPGAWTSLLGKLFTLKRARLADVAIDRPPGLTVMDGEIFGICGDGRAIRIQELLVDGTPACANELESLLTEFRISSIN